MLGVDRQVKKGIGQIDRCHVVARLCHKRDLLDGFHLEVGAIDILIQCAQIEHWSTSAGLLWDGKHGTDETWRQLMLGHRFDRLLGEEVLNGLVQLELLVLGQLMLVWGEVC